MANQSGAVIRKRGRVVENLPSATFKVELEGTGENLLAHISGRMRRNRIHVLPGDSVEVEMSPYDETRGRIVYRFK